MKKITVRAVSVIIALLLVITSVSAAAFEAPISTYRYSSVSSMSVFLSISSNGYATCTAEMSLYENISAEMTITLYRVKTRPVGLLYRRGMLIGRYYRHLKAGAEFLPDIIIWRN